MRKILSTQFHYFTYALIAIIDDGDSDVVDNDSDNYHDGDDDGDSEEEDNDERL